MSDSMRWILIGVLTVLIGVLILGNAALASVAIAIMTGAALLVGGGVQIVGGFSVETLSAKIFAMVIGVIMVLLGWSMLAHPLQGVISLSMAVLILFAAGGCARIYMSLRMRGTQMFLPMLISGVLSLVLAVVIWTSASEEPAALFQLLGVLLGIETVLNGVGFIILGLFYRGHTDAQA